MSEEAFTVGEWRGMPNYRCTRCPYATLDVEEIAVHIATAHQPPVTRRPTGLVDSKGDPIIAEE